MPRRTHPADTLRHSKSILILALGLFAAQGGCDSGSAIQKLVVKGAFVPSKLDFGDVIVRQTKTLQVELKNTGAPVFTIDGIEVPDNYSFGGEKETIKGKTIQPGDSMMLDVIFSPVAEGPDSGQIKVRSGTTEVTLDVQGNGAVMHVPNLAIDPGSIDFGTVAIHTSMMKSVKIINTGNADGVVDSAKLMSTGAAPDPMGDFMVSTPMPMTVPQGGSISVDVVFNPGSEGAHADMIMFHQGSDAGPDLMLGINGQGKIPLGDIVCMPSSVDFGTIGRGMAVTKPVTCSASGGPARLIGASVSQTPQYFSVPMPPSTIDLAPSQMGVTFDVVYKPDGMVMAHTGADRPDMGMLTVQYNGARGMQTVQIPLAGKMSQPPPETQAIALVLSWDTNQTDEDIHLERPGALPFDPGGGDCYYANRNPMWGPDTTYSPYLDRDVIDGYGPEHLNLQHAQPGTYTVTAHYFSDHGHGDSTATVQVFVGGQMVGSFQHRTHCDDLWTVGTINWDGNAGTFTPVNTVQPMSGQGICF